ncbi:MAG: hypothetical protein NT085_03485 [candidate division SR1 bacterium]|nr:hypothetical protein [candidate division SR1 bacterium]
MDRYTTKTFILLIFCLFTLIGRVIFASNEGTTLSLGINDTITHMVYTPAHSSGLFTSGNVYASITGSSSITGTLDYIVTGNGIYTFSYLRGTGPYTSGGVYGPTNLWNHLTFVDNITWIDKELPIFNIIFNQSGYATINFSDNNPGVIATLNNIYYENNATIIENGNYIFRVTDIAGNSVFLNFSIFHAPPYGPIQQGGGGGQILYRDVCPDGDFSSSYYDNSCIYNHETGHTSAYTGGNILGLGFSQEFINAYLWAHAYSITTMPTIQQADMTGVILRKHLAKMLSTFAVQFVGKTPDTTKKCVFSDMNYESKEMQSFAVLSCQLGLMGLQEDGITPQKKFEPNLLVSRAQFGTALSRLLFGNTYNIQPGERTLFITIKNNIKSVISSIGLVFSSAVLLHQELLRYSKHLHALKDHDIMRQINDPMMPEIRGYVMLMLMRADALGVGTPGPSL